MSEPEFPIAYLGDPHLAAHATSALPVWLWTPDATRVLWANPTAAAILGESSPAALARRHFDTGQPAPAQIARLASGLAYGAPGRLERLRGFGAGVGRTLTCLCSRIAIDAQTAILVVATERAGPDLPLAERVRRLLAESTQALAVFTPQGRLLHATRAALVPLGGAQSLAALGAEALAADAMRDGTAGARLDGYALVLTRLGSDEATVLLARVETVEVTEPAPAPVAETEAAPPASTESVEAPPGPEPTAIPSEPETVAATPTAPPPAEDEPEPSAVEQEPEPRASAPEPAVAELEPAPPAHEPGPPTVVQEPEPPTPSAPVEEPPAPTPSAVAKRRHPLRFVWQMDADGCFTLGPGEFVVLIGPRIAAMLGQPWGVIASELGIDPGGEIARAISSRNTWSGIEVAWPVDGTDERLKVELSGLPVFDRDRNFGGYRGFGVCRDLEQIDALVRARNAPPQAADETAQQIPPPPEAAEMQPETENVVPFRTPAASAAFEPPALSPVEHRAFSELARKLTARLKEDNGETPQEPPAEPSDETRTPGLEQASEPAPGSATVTHTEVTVATTVAWDESEQRDRPILDRLPVGILVYRLDALLHANRAFLEWTGHPNLEAFAEAGGLDSLFIDTDNGLLGEDNGTTLAVATQDGDRLLVEGRLFRIPWNGEQALVLMLVPAASDDRRRTAEAARRLAEAEAQELGSILDIVADGVIVVDREGQLLSANRGAEALFGLAARDDTALSFADLFVAESRGVALDELKRLARGDVAGKPVEGREVTARGRSSGPIPLLMTMGRIGDDGEKFCAVFRDLSQWKRSEQALTEARRQAEKASAAKSEFLAKISHEIRTPLNAIIGFSEVMMDERLGSIGNERYREYLKDIHSSGAHVVSLLNDLLDLSKIEAGKLDLHLASVDLNELTHQCVAIMQPQANRERIIIRSSHAEHLPQIEADARSLRQIVLNLLSNSIKFTGAGGQVIVSTALTDTGNVVLRVRDTGIGMSEQDIATALEPFRQLATSGRAGSGGTGLGLPLSKALAEANHASFAIRSAPNSGTLVEISFPPMRAAAE
jgi:PAS domain S-box-containing protein